MDSTTVLVGIALIIWGVGYRKLIQSQLKTEKDNRTQAEGKVVRVLRQEEDTFLEIEFENETGIHHPLALIWREEDKNAVGNLVFIRYDQTNLKRCDIDWEKEMKLNEKAMKKGGRTPSTVMMLVGLAIVLKGLRIF